METFLGKLAEEIYKKEKDRLYECAFVFPGRRAALFFTKYLSSYIEKPSWSPDFLTITDLMTKISGYRLADSFQLIFHVYKLYKNRNENPESIDTFYSLAEVLLNDFNDIDKNLINASDLFQNLSNVKFLEDRYDYLSEEQVDAIRSFWSHFQIQNQSAEKERFTGVWDQLLVLYNDLRNELQKSGLVYEGMIYRKVVEMIQNNHHIDVLYHKIYFIGFNALTQSEKEILVHLQKLGIAEFVWDYDKSYVNDKQHEAGFFIRENLQEFKELNIESSNDFMFSSEKEIEYIASPNDPGQVKIMSKVLLDLFRRKEFEKNNTAVVLADEHLIPQVLHSIPSEYSDINITMGYPVKDTPVFSLVECLIDLQKNKKGRSFYYKDVTRVLDHQYISFLRIKDFDDLKEDVLAKNRIYIDQNSIPDDKLGKLIFKPISHPVELSEYLKEILYNIYLLNSEDEVLEEGTIDLQKEYLYNVYLALNRLSDILNENEPSIKIETYLNILKKIIRGMIIPFSGEPLKGLQVMGVLETRALDFENLIILSMNEGIFPRAGATASLIPYSLRKGFGLPTVEHQDRIYAYYFYRLIQRAKNITLIYNTKTEGIRTGEMSRFLFQMKYLNYFHVKEKNLSVIVNQQNRGEIVVQKSNVELDVLKKYYSPDKPYLSPSGLNTYLNCTLRFYFRYIAGIKVPDKVTEEVDYLVFGNLLHMTMKILYEEFKNITLSEEEIKKLRKGEGRIKSIIEASIKNEWLKSESDAELSGRNLIAKEILLRYVKQLLRVDEKIAPFTLRGLEDEYKSKIGIEISGSPVQVKIGGKLDRIDEIDGIYRIIDYKTGSVKKSFSSIESLFKREDDNRNNEAFQTLLYCWLYDKSDLTPIIPGLYDIKGMNESKFSPEFKMAKKELLDFNEVKNEFEMYLRKLIEDIFDPNIAFTQTQNQKICENCDFINICKRDE